jgi:hypothetical protein
MKFRYQNKRFDLILINQKVVFFCDTKIKSPADTIVYITSAGLNDKNVQLLFEAFGMSLPGYVLSVCLAQFSIVF